MALTPPVGDASKYRKLREGISRAKVWQIYGKCALSLPERCVVVPAGKPPAPPGELLVQVSLERAVPIVPGRLPPEQDGQVFQRDRAAPAAHLKDQPQLVAFQAADPSRPAGQVRERRRRRRRGPPGQKRT